ncbi:MAG: hypothetical protein NT107_08265 [Planctomycetota bacterium]|nr:hypothetical protein [Planctomycetota bacterium]
MALRKVSTEASSLRALMTAFGPFLLVTILLPFVIKATNDSTPNWPIDQILRAIREVESSDRENAPDGDQGRAIGIYQIHLSYWVDALAEKPQLGGTYQDCRQSAYAEQIVRAYMQRYAKEAWQSGNAETIARVHNGGPRGPDKPATQIYWQRVKAHLMP